MHWRKPRIKIDNGQWGLTYKIVLQKQSSFVNLELRDADTMEDIMDTLFSEYERYSQEDTKEMASEVNPSFS